MLWTPKGANIPGYPGRNGGHGQAIIDHTTTTFNHN